VRVDVAGILQRVHLGDGPQVAAAAGLALMSVDLSGRDFVAAMGASFEIDRVEANEAGPSIGDTGLGDDLVGDGGCFECGRDHGDELAGGDGGQRGAGGPEPGSAVSFVLGWGHEVWAGAGEGSGEDVVDDDRRTWTPLGPHG
jgi:hypothetical protein